MASSSSLREYWRLARHNRNFRRLWTAQIVSELGDWFYAVAIYALLYEYTGKASSLAVAIILQVLPQALVTPFVGPVADRVSRKRLMIAADVARAGIVAAMLLVRGPETAWIVYPLLFAETVMAAFFEPARIAVIPNITGDEKAVVANTLASATWSMNFAVGAVLGGVAAAYLGRDAVFLINAASFLASAVLIGRMDFTEPHLETAPPLRARDLLDFSDMRSGLRYIRSDRRLLATVLAKAGIGVVGGTFVIFPVLGMKVYPPMRPGMPAEAAGTLAMSFLLGSRGLGALLGPLATASWAGNVARRLRWCILAGFAAAGIGYFLLGFAPNLLLACAVVVFAASGTSIVWVYTTTLLQVHSEDRFRGRVFAVDYGVVTLAISVVAWVAGVAADGGVSPQWIAHGLGVFMVLPFAAWVWGMRKWSQPAVGSRQRLSS